MIVCDKICLGVVSTYSLFFCDESIFSVDETPGERIYDNWAHFGGLVFRRMRELRESLAFAQNNQYAKVANFGMTYL